MAGLKWEPAMHAAQMGVGAQAVEMKFKQSEFGMRRAAADAKAIAVDVKGGGLSALGAALTQIGAPKDQIIKYEAALKVDKYLVVAHGSAQGQGRARGVLAQARTIAAVSA